MTIASRGPEVLRLLAEDFCEVKDVTISLTRRTPFRRNAASRTSSNPVRAPVEEAAARLAASLHRALITMWWGWFVLY